MTQRRARPKSKARPMRTPEPVVPSTVRWIVLVDEAPIRGRALEEHRRLDDEATQLRERLELFETSEILAFTRWEATVLGPLLTDIREADQAIRQKQELLDDVEDEVFFTGCSRLTAYRRIMKELEGPDPEAARAARMGDDEDPDDDGGDWGGDPMGGNAGGPGEHLFGDRDLPPGFEAADYDRLSAQQKKEFSADYQAMAQIFEMMTGRFAPSLADALRASRARAKQAHGHPEPEPPGRPEKTSTQQRATSRLKELYRLLVRRLHPDHNPRQTARERELWHTVQAAYQAGDVESLEAVAARLEMGMEGNTATMPVYLLLRLVRDLRAALRSLKTKLATARKHPAWDFTAKATVLAAYEKKQRTELTRHLRSLRHHLDFLTANLDDLAMRAARKPKGQKRQAGPPKKAGAQKKAAPRQARAVQDDFFSYL